VIVQYKQVIKNSTDNFMFELLLFL